MVVKTPMNTTKASPKGSPILVFIYSFLLILVIPWVLGPVPSLGPQPLRGPGPAGVGWARVDLPWVSPMGLWSG